jgi:hypothetical protein
MPWKPAVPSQLQRENDALKTTIVCLRRELENKRGYAGRLEYLLHQRTETIDQLHGTINRLREQNRRLDAEADRSAEMVQLRLAPVP